MENNQVIAFTGGIIDRADARRNDGTWLEEQRHSRDLRVLALADLKPLLRGGALCWLAPDDIPQDAWAARPAVLLGLIDGEPRFALDLSGLSLPAGRGDYVDLRAAAGLLPPDELALAGLARSLVDWHARHRFCAVCGGPTAVRRGGAHRQCITETCAAEHFPRVDPVAIMLVARGDFCLMGRQSRFPPGMFSALAGFIEAGESIEEAVRREIMEEAGVVVGAVRYIASQPWPFPSSLMIGCLAEALSEELIPDSDELEELRWFSREEVRQALCGKAKDFFVPPPIAIAHHLLKAWAEGG